MNVLKSVVVLCLVLVATVPGGTSEELVNDCCYRIEEELSDIKAILYTLVEYGDYTIPRDCYEVQESGRTVSGVYTIRPDDANPFQVYCDMDTDGGGWTVFQRRQDGTEDFYNNWEEYADGFGSLEGEHWLGNNKLHYLTNQKTYGLRVDLADFDDATRFAKYDSFVVADSADNYRLQIGSYSGDAGDSMSMCDNQQFTTLDQDNDIWGDSNCAVSFRGAWWYRACHEANLNGAYLEATHSTFADGVNWKKWRGHYYSLKFTEMKLRPV